MGVLMSVSTQWEVINVLVNQDFCLVAMVKDVEVRNICQHETEFFPK